SRRVCVWDLPQGKLWQDIPVASQWVRDLQFAPDSKTLAWCGTSGSPPEPSEGIVLWEVATGRKRLQLDGHQKGRTYGVAFSPDGRLAATAHGVTVECWDVAAGRRLWSERDFQPPVQPALKDPYADGVAFSADGKRVVATVSDSHFPGPSRTVLHVRETA